MSNKMGAEHLKAVPVRRRSAARLASIQITYQAMITGESAEKFAPQFLLHYAADVSQSFRVKDFDKDHLIDLYSGVSSATEDLDCMISKALTVGWSLERLARIELAVLRCGVFELTSMPHIPVRAVISEYAALSDVCGCDVGFVNALLDSLARSVRVGEMKT